MTRSAQDLLPVRLGRGALSVSPADNPDLVSVPVLHAPCLLKSLFDSLTVHRSLLLLCRLFCVVAFLLPTTAAGQELNAKVTINTQALGAEDKAAYNDLERRLADLLNLTRWTNTTFSSAERIECSFAINLLTHKDEDKYTAELLVTARRPVYNASYTTTTFVYRDRELNFDYRQFDQLEWNPENLQNNLVATVVFYAYAVLSFDFDSFAPLGGNPYRSTMRQIVASAQGKQDWSGWKAYESDRNRYALSEALNDPAQEPFRRAWYRYHRQGLDEMVANPNRGRTTVLETIPELQETQKARPMSPLLPLFAAAKLEEMVQILSKANDTEREEAYKTLSKVFPTETDKLDPLKRVH